MSGEPVQNDDIELWLERNGIREEAHFAFSYTPLHGNAGAVDGFFCACQEITGQIMAERALRASEAEARSNAERVQLALDSGAIIGTWLWDLPTNRFTVDKAFADAFGIDPALGRDGLSLEQVIATVHPEDKPGLAAAIDKAIERGGSYAHQYRVRRSDGRFYWIEANGRVDKAEDGTPLRFPGVLLDLEERRATQAQLLETSRRLDAILNNTREAVFLMDEQQHCVYANRAAEILTGYSFEQMQGRPLHDVIHCKKPDGSHYPLEECPIDRAFPERAQMSGEELFVAPDGALYPVAFTASPVLDDGGQPVGTVIEARGITEEKAAEAARRESEALLDAVIDAIPVGVIIADAKGRILRDNVANREIWGIPPETDSWERYGDWEGYWPDNGERVKTEEWALARAVLKGETVKGELVEGVRFDDGAHRYFLNSASPVCSADGEIIAGVVAEVDVTQRLAAERQQRETEERYRLVAQATNDAIWDWDLQSNLVQWNAALFDVFGHDPATVEPTGEWWVDHIHPDDRARIDSDIHAVIDGAGTHWTAEYRFLKADGSHLHVFDRGYVIRDEAGRARRMIGAMQDLTERRRAEQALRDLNERLEQRVAEEVAERGKAEEALRQAQKMEAVGQLTGGIAHDFNNLLTVVTGNIDMAGRALAKETAPNARIQRALDNALKGAERAAALTQRLLAFSRRQPLAPKPIAPDRLVSGMSDLLQRSLGERVQLEVVTSPGLWRVEADPNQLESAILNLAVNARDAMPEGGTLTVETANARLDETYAAEHAEVAPGQYVVIAVTDTGSGMSKETAARVFEPFFTTKEVGKGTGLGLSMVYGFTKQSGGHVKVYTEEGHGTTVKIYLPRLMSDVAVEEVATANGPEVSGARELILVVEDDDDVRGYTVECLRELGYRVREAHDGEAALRVFQEGGEAIDLLFTDVVMPGMTGRELADRVRESRPEMKVLFTSGYTRNAIVHGGRLDEGVEMISKPFTYTSLARKIADVLDKGRTGRVLLVEQDATLRMFAAEGLVGGGYAVEEALTGAEALAKVRAARGTYDAVFLDEAMAGASGIAVAAELRKLYADLPILLAGDDPAALEERFAQDRCTGAIGKPYNAARLLRALEAVGVRCRTKAQNGN